MIRIAITGPECSGKTSLMNWLAAKIFDARAVHEYSREYLESKESGYIYNSGDIEHVARQQATRLNKAFRSSNDALICDTEFYVLDIWWREKIGSVNQEFEEYKTTFDFDLFLLCKPDIPWVQDGLRENPYDRGRLFEMYQTALEDDKRSYIIVSGMGEERMSVILKKILLRFPNLMLKEED
jgi:nicotinamide riboside kinase